MLIGDLAQRTGVSPRSLRHYDRRGLLPVRRRSNAYREFPEQAVSRVKQIRALLDVGLGLEAVAELLPCFDADGALGPCSAARARIVARIGELDASIGRALETRDMLTRVVAAWEETRR